MGGVGKTTLAKVVFNTLSYKFDQCCFLADVRESSKGYIGLVTLQKQLFSKLLGSHSINQLYQVNDGINMFGKEGVLKNKKVLIVLDDVDEKEQIKSLARKGDWFGFGSRIIITTRDQSVLMIKEEATRENVSTYDVREMEFNHALKLFSRHAFRRDSPPDDRVFLSEKIVHTLGKLPLALEITGSSLNGKSKELWVDTWKKLQEAPPKQVQKILMVTYDKLDRGQKEVFLDIACFFVNKEKTNPFYMWNACGYHPHDAIEVLFLMSLIKLRNNNTFWMHDQVRDLGRDIIRKEKTDPFKRSRVWDYQEALSILTQKEGSRKIQAMSLSKYDGSRENILTCDGFAQLRNLRFFQGNGVCFVGDFNNLLPSLRWLSLKHYSGKFEATNFHLTNLLVLDLSWSCISEEWIGWEQIKVARKLKVLDLSNSKNLRRMPDLSTWVFLERLILKGCNQLIEIDPSIGKLKLLTTLNLFGCYSLREVPKEIGCLQASTKIVMPCPLLLKTLGDMQSVLTLDVSNSNSYNFPLLIRLLVNIRQLNLSNCTDIKVLPNSIENLQSLIEFDLSWTSISHLPDSIDNLKQLKVLRMSGMSKITTLPSAIGLVEKLEKLDLSSTNIGHLPDSIGNLKQLKVLKMSGMGKITKLPSAIGLVKNLEELDARGCYNLTGEISEEIGRLSCLRILDLSNTHISRLPISVSHLSNLQTLMLEKCPELKQLPELPPSLTDLRWGPKSCWCSSKELIMYEYWEHYQELHWPRRRLSPETLVSALPTSIGTLSQLKTLKLCCKNVQFLPQLPSSLRELQLRDLVTTRQSDFSNLKNLSILTFYGCSLEPSGLYGVESAELRMEFCELRPLDAPLQLEMKRLRSLEMAYCEFHPKVLDLSRMKNLHKVNLKGCLSLVEICGFEELKSLCSLLVVVCFSLERMSDLSKLKNLSKLEVRSCHKLERLQGLDHLESLKKWEISGIGDFMLERHFSFHEMFQKFFRWL
ncbi:hypothetical protein BT93_B1231 [Corymbia citriodora subsp. variegata]|nr:hypothetical protein BT93_B1231 [Corymbia citriodora subsp. variegata]